MVIEYRQLLLPFVRGSTYDERDFLPAESNSEALAWLETSWPDKRLTLWGSGGCGKSHLLHLWAARTGALQLCGPDLCDLKCLPDAGCVTLDDADAIQNEHLFLHLLNTCRDRGLLLLLSGRTAPSKWQRYLPDLSSRLRAIAAVEIRPPTDVLLGAMLVRLLADRQLFVAESVQKWLLLQLPRDPKALREAVARLDRASLLLGSGITRLLAAQVLAEDGLIPRRADEVCITRTNSSIQHAFVL